MIIDKALYSIDENKFSLKKDQSVAIIMRTKDRPILLARAINSVISQTYNNWHLYLINDGGETDPIDQIVKINQSDLVDKLTLIHNSTSLGLEAASNCGFKIANEEYLVVHDDDDSWHPDFLKETVNFLSTSECAVAVLTNCTVIHEEIHNDIVKRISSSDWWYWKDTIDISMLLKGRVTPPISLLIRMSVAKQIGGRNENLPVLGDWDYNLRLFRVGEIKTLNKKLAYYHHRINLNNTTYGNSVIADESAHENYQIKYLDILIRSSLIDYQTKCGKLNVLLNELEIKDNELKNQINNLYNKLNDIQENVNYLRRKSFPLKKLAAKIRVKIRKWKNK
ncbi:putative glycosyltransferase [Snodgrassella alvi SCGC AB-598-O02]|nr:putative glycosyltransferase [Snodgrassella alvi SCGC AB-598-O02]